MPVVVVVELEYSGGTLVKAVVGERWDTVSQREEEGHSRDDDSDGDKDINLAWMNSMLEVHDREDLREHFSL